MTSSTDENHVVQFSLFAY